MLIKDVHFEREPEPITIMPLPNGKTDIWIRRGIKAKKQKEGKATHIEHFAEEEAYARIDSDGVSAEVVLGSFDEWFEKISDWQALS